MEILVGMTTQNRCVALSPQLVHKVAVCPEPCINKCREVMCLDVLPLSLSALDAAFSGGRFACHSGCSCFVCLMSCRAHGNDDVDREMRAEEEGAIEPD